ncbi:MAG: type IV toxin-antitoxin system AbiEi family antitoxin domain-containing protein [Solirubrobacterales bacterium]
MRPQVDIREIERRVVRLAERQWGVITYEQLLAAGLSPSAVRNRVRAGRLHRIHRGVYAVGHRALAREGWWKAAVLACGPGAVLSHTSAAALWGMLDPRPGPIHITVPTKGGRARRKALVIHRATLPPRQTTHRALIPVTRTGRTLSDLRRIISTSEYQQAIREAEFRHLDTGDREHDGTRSDLEARVLGLLRRHRIPIPEVNVRVGRYVVDCLWRAERLIVELDGFRGHRGREAFEQDRARDAELTRLGYRVLRFSWRQVAGEPLVVAAAIRAALDA